MERPLVNIYIYIKHLKFELFIINFLLEYDLNFWNLDACFVKTYTVILLKEIDKNK